MVSSDATFECRFRGHAGRLNLHLYNPHTEFKNEDFDGEILKNCLTMIGPKAKVYWLQNELPELSRMVRGRAFNPMVYKKIKIFATPTERFVERLLYIYNQESKKRYHQFFSIVINLRKWESIEATEITSILRAMRCYSNLLRCKFRDKEDQHRLILHLPGTQPVLKAIAHQRVNVVRL